MTALTLEKNHAPDADNASEPIVTVQPAAPSDDTLLTAEEERWLARTIFAAKSAAETTAPTSPDHAHFLEHLRGQGQNARDRLIQQNLRLVYREVFRFRGHWLDLADLVQEGCLGLLHAAERFDAERGVRFSTYAVPWIRQAVDRAAQTHGRVVRLPRRVVSKPRDESGQPARPDLLPAASLDLPADPASSETLAASLPDPSADPERDAINAVLIESLVEALNRCPKREREVIFRRFGLAGWSPQSHEAIASDLGVCRQRVRQIENSALRRLRLSEGLTDQVK